MSVGEIHPAPAMDEEGRRQMVKPSIKGSSISSLIEDVEKLCSSGRLSDAQRDEYLTAEDCELLGEPVNPAGWYDLESYTRMAELLCEVQGGGKEMLRERGAAAARRLAEAGIYQQIESVARLREAGDLNPSERFTAYGRGLKLITTLSRSILNFSDWKVLPSPVHPDRYQIEVHDAQQIPEVLAYTIEGFINGLSELDESNRHQPNALWKLERVSPDLLIYHMQRALLSRVQ